MSNINQIVGEKAGLLSLAIAGVVWFYFVYNSIEPGYFSNVAMIILFVFFIYSMKGNRDFLVINSYFLFLVAGVGVSLVSVNEGAYLYELFELTVANKSLVNNLFLFFLIFFVGVRVHGCLPLTIYDKYIVDDAISDLMIRGFVLIYMAMGLVFIVFFIGGGYAINNVERFEYWDALNFKEGLHLSSLMAHLGFLLGVVYVIKSKKLAVYLCLYGMVCLVMAGHKFTGLVQLLILFSIPLLINFTLTSKNKLIILGLVLVFSISGYLLIYTNYVMVYGEETAMDVFSGRIAGQSQMLWALDNQSLSYGFTLSEILTHYFGFGASDVDSGMKFLMYQVASSELVTRYIEKGIVFTFAGPGSASLFFGYYGGVFVALVMGLWLGILTWLVTICIKSKNLAACFFSIKAYLNYLINLTNGGGDWLFDYRIYVYFLLGVVFLVGFKSKGLHRE